MTVTKRAKLKHALFDCDYLEKPKLVALHYRFGNDGIALIFATTLMLSKATDAEMDEDCIRALGKQLSISEERCNEFMAYCLEREILSRGSKSYLISNRRVVEDQEKLGAQQEEWKRKKQNQRGQKEIPDAVPILSQGTKEGQEGDATGSPLKSLNTEQLNNEQLKTEDLKNEDPKKKTVEKLLIGKYTKITSDEHQRFLSTWGPDETAYWLATFDLAYEQNPAKFCKQYSNHAAAIRNWRKRALEDGKVWDKTRKLYLHPRNSTLNLQGARNGPHR